PSVEGAARQPGLGGPATPVPAAIQAPAAPPADAEVAVPAGALPVWPPSINPMANGYQPRTGSAVLPAPPAPAVPAPATLPGLLPPVSPAPLPAAPAPDPGHVHVGEPVWPEAPEAVPTTSPQYGEWARRQRPQGTVYGGSAPGQDVVVTPAGSTSASLEM